MYKNYIFDLYGTLVDIHTDENDNRLWRCLSEFYGFKGADYTVDELKEQYNLRCKEEQLKAMIRFDTNCPDISIEKVFSGLYKYKGVKPSKQLSITTGEMFRIMSTEYIKLYDGVIDLLELLKSQNKKIFLLSNAQSIFTDPEVRLLGIHKYFDAIYYSSVYGRAKPDRLFMDKIIEDHNLQIKQCIMIGNDYKADVGVANNTGMDSLYIHSNISPEIEGDVKSTYKIMDGDLKNVIKFLKELQIV